MAIKKVALNPWHILNAEKNPTECVLMLPGRDNSGSVMGKVYQSLGLENVLLISITPKKLEWYPLPNGVNDQEAALEGQASAYETIEDAGHWVQAEQPEAFIACLKAFVADVELHTQDFHHTE